MKTGQLYFLIFFLLIPASVFSFTDEELKHEEALTNIARSRCATEFIEGKDYKIKVLANGNIQVSLLGKKGGGLNGTFEYTREEWEGRQRVLREHQMSDNKDFRKCVREELGSLRKSYKPPTPESLSLPDLVATDLAFPLTSEWNIQQVKFTGGVWHVTKSGSPYIEVGIEAQGYSGSPNAIEIAVYADGHSTGRVKLGKGTASRRSPTHFVGGFFVFPSSLPNRGPCQIVAVIDPHNNIAERDKSNNEIAISGFVHNPGESY